MARSTREAILTAAAELMRHKGYGAVGMKDIAAASGAPIGSLYHHFRGGKVQIAREALVNAGARLWPADPVDRRRARRPRRGRRRGVHPGRRGHGSDRVRQHVPGRQRRGRGRRHRRGTARHVGGGVHRLARRRQPPTSSLRGVAESQARDVTTRDRRRRWRARSCWPGRCEAPSRCWQRAGCWPRSTAASS